MKAICIKNIKEAELKKGDRFILSLKRRKSYFGDVQIPKDSYKLEIGISNDEKYLNNYCKKLTFK